MDRLKISKRLCLITSGLLLLAGCTSARQAEDESLPIWGGKGIGEFSTQNSNLSLRQDLDQPAKLSKVKPQPVGQMYQVAEDESPATPLVSQSDPVAETIQPATAVQAPAEIPLASPIASSLQTTTLDSESNQTVVRGQDPGGYSTPVVLQDPNLPQTDPYTTQGSYPVQNYQAGQIIGSPQPTPRTGSPNEPIPGVFPQAPVANTFAPPNFADIDVLLNETQTGRITFGAAVNSDSGVVGQVIIDERNFDIGAFPRSFSEIVDGTAWRGAGQSFRLELVPGDEVQRYMASFSEPYFLDFFSLSASAYFFDRQFFDWDEQRLGGRVSLGYRLTPDLSVSVGTRLEEVQIRNPRVPNSDELNLAVGTNRLFIGNVSLIHDTRDHPFLATQGSYTEISYHQAFGDFDYPRGDIDHRRYFLIYQRPDFSGRHTLSVGTRLGFSGSQTPIFENYFAGGFSTLRGYDFRGATPLQNDVRVGGEFQWLNTVEYTFPITADDMIKGVLFCDFGTVEESITIDEDNFRVAPGFGFRVHLPVGGAGGAPLAFDFAFPVASADDDDEQVFSFYLGVLR